MYHRSAIFLLTLLSGFTFAQDLFITASIIDSELSDYRDPEAEPCQPDKGCIEFSYWRTYTVDNIRVISGLYEPETLDFLMASHSNLAKAEAPLKVLLVLGNSGLEYPKYKVKDWSAEINIACLNSALENHESFITENIEHNDHCYIIDELLPYQ